MQIKIHIWKSQNLIALLAKSDAAHHGVVDLCRQSLGVEVIDLRDSDDCA